jgi:8-oxo-dGTP pyrophosphatase MutT (NUDIX family)
MADFIAELKQRLSGRASRSTTEWEARPAAVLIPLYEDAGEWHLLLTRRTESVENHRGQVSFPGGVIEPGEDAVQAALRETYEEIGVDPADVEILGTLDALYTVTQFEVFPVVGLIPWPYPLQLHEVEVARVFGVPIRWLADEDNLEVQTRASLLHGPRIPVLYYKPHDNEIVWGATARIIQSFLALFE